MTLVDTSVWIDFFNGAQADWTDRLAHLLANEPILLGDLVFCELLQGFRFDRDFSTIAQHLPLREDSLGP